MVWYIIGGGFVRVFERDRKLRVISFVLAFLFTLILCFGCLSDCFTVTVYADDAEFKQKLEEFLDHAPSDKEIHDWSAIICTMREDGVDDDSIAAIMGNMSAEGGGLYAIEGHFKPSKEGKTYFDFEDGGTYEFDYVVNLGSGTGGEGIGLVQWSWGRHDKLCELAESGDYTYVTVKHYRQKPAKFVTDKIPDIEGQAFYILTELHGDYSNVLDEMKAASTLSEKTNIFMNKYEVPQDLTDRTPKAEKAVPVVKACEGISGKGVDKEKKGQESAATAQKLYDMGIWDEDQFVDFCSLIDEHLVLPSDMDLSFIENHEVKNWGYDVNARKENKVMGYVRAVVMFFGILLCVYTVFLYVAYQFDRNQSFIDIQLLNILTLNHLGVAPEERKSTYATNNTLEKKSSVRTVAHKDMLIVCGIGFSISILIISGRLYSIISAVVEFITERTK